MRRGFTCGTFDLLHVGHIKMLQEAKKHCDWLIVGIQVDPTIDRPKKQKPIQSLYERTVQLEACRDVDQIVVYQTEQDLEDIFALGSFIDIRFIGMDWGGQEEEITGFNICKERGTDIYYTKRNHRFSSTELRERIKKAK